MEKLRFLQNCKKIFFCYFFCHFCGTSFSSLSLRVLFSLHIPVYFSLPSSLYLPSICTRAHSLAPYRSLSYTLTNTLSLTCTLSHTLTLTHTLSHSHSLHYSPMESDTNIHMDAMAFGMGMCCLVRYYLSLSDTLHSLSLSRSHFSLPPLLPPSLSCSLIQRTILPLFIALFSLPLSHTHSRSLLTC